MYVAVRQTWRIASRLRARNDDAGRNGDEDADCRFAEQLQEARLRAGVCLLGLSEHTGLDVATISSWERGEDQPGACVRAAVLDVLREQGREGK